MVSIGIFVTPISLKGSLDACSLQSCCSQLSLLPACPAMLGGWGRGRGGIASSAEAFQSCELADGSGETCARCLAFSALSEVLITWPAIFTCKGQNGGA